jgi:TatD DNase family protein
MIINAHTHQLSEESISVLNCYPDEDLPNIRKSDFISCGIHPWFLKSTDLKRALEILEDYCRLNKVQAIGECGLDKNVHDMEGQIAIFEQQIQLAEKYRLPMIIHSVKTHHKILEIRKKSAKKNPWLIHGFNGSIEIAEQFSNQNIFISFGQNVLTHPLKVQKILNQVDMNFVLFETDDKDVSITEIYGGAASLMQVPAIELERRIEDNFKKFFDREWIG